MKEYLQPYLRRIQTILRRFKKEYLKRNNVGYFLHENTLYINQHSIKNKSNQYTILDLKNDSDVKRLYNIDYFHHFTRFRTCAITSYKRSIHHNFIFPKTIKASFEPIFISELQEQFNYNSKTHDVFYYTTTEADTLRVFFTLIDRNEQFELIDRYHQHNICPEVESTIGHVSQGLLKQHNITERVTFIVQLDDLITLSSLDSSHIYKSFTVCKKTTDKRTLNQIITNFVQEEQIPVWTLGLDTSFNKKAFNAITMTQNKGHLDTVHQQITIGLSHTFERVMYMLNSNGWINNIYTKLQQYNHFSRYLSIRIVLTMFVISLPMIIPTYVENIKREYDIQNALNNALHDAQYIDTQDRRNASVYLNNQINYHPTVPTSDTMLSELHGLNTFKKLNLCHYEYNITSLPSPTAPKTPYKSSCTIQFYSPTKALIKCLKREFDQLTPKPHHVQISHSKDKVCTVKLFFEERHV
ncbi:hypothetical protein N9N03_02650 [Chlamydiia bacterium]|nr:hypothetical protein [Chlamydiia bacterium]